MVLRVDFFLLFQRTAAIRLDTVKETGDEKFICKLLSIELFRKIRSMNSMVNR